MTIWNWIEAHAVIIMIAWPLFTGGVNLVFGQAHKYVLTHPRLASALGVLEGVGFTPRAVIAWTASLLASRASVDVVTSITADKLAQSTRPPPFPKDPQ